MRGSYNGEETLPAPVQMTQDYRNNRTTCQNICDYLANNKAVHTAIAVTCVIRTAVGLNSFVGNGFEVATLMC